MTEEKLEDTGQNDIYKIYMHDIIIHDYYI